MELEKLNAAKLEEFRREIDELADAEITELDKQSRTRKTAYGKAKADTAVREANAAFNADMNAITAEFRKEISRCDFDTKKAVLSHRNELINTFFRGLTEKLSSFAESSEYGAFLQRSLDRAAKELSFDDMVIFAAPKDVEKVKVLTSYEVKADAKIILGGICAMGKKRGMFVDLTLDKAINDEQTAFSSIAELRL